MPIGTDIRNFADSRLEQLQQFVATDPIIQQIIQQARASSTGPGPLSGGGLQNAATMARASAAIDQRLKETGHNVTGMHIGGVGDVRQDQSFPWMRAILTGALAFGGAAALSGLAGAVGGASSAAGESAAATGATTTGTAAGAAGAVLPSTTIAPTTGALAAGLPSGAGAAAGTGTAAATGVGAGIKSIVSALPKPSWKSILGGVASAVGGALPNKSSSSTMPTLDPAYGPLQQQVLDMVTKRLSGNTDLSGYAANGQQSINRTYNTIKQSQANDLTARGLGTSPVAGVVDATRENARGGQMAALFNSLPLLQRQFQNEDLGLGRDVLSLGRGQTTNTSTGGGASGVATNLAQYLGYLTGRGAFNRVGAYGGAGTPGYPGDGYSDVNNPLATYG